MKIIRPITIDSSNLVTNIAEDDGPEYSATTAYALDDIVVNASGMSPTHHAYQSLTDGNLGHALSDSAYWLDLGPTNPYRMFDQSIGTVTTGATGIDVTVTSPTRVDGLALFGLDADQVRVIVTNVLLGTVYDQTYSLTSDSGVNTWYDYFTEEIVSVGDLVLTDLPPVNTATVEVIISATGGGAVSAGALILGQTRELGLGAFYGAEGGIIDYSRKTTDDFGNTSLVERSFAKRHSFKSMLDNGEIDAVFTMLAQYRATPVVWVGTDIYEMTWLYGWARDWSIAISYPTQSLLTLEIEGLT